MLNRYFKNVSADLLDETYQQYVVAMYQKYPHVSLEGIQTLLDLQRTLKAYFKTLTAHSEPGIPR